MMDAQFQGYCRKWSADVSKIADEKQRMLYFQEHLPQLLLDRAAVLAVLDHMTHGRKWPNLRYGGLFSHEVLLYLDPSRRFSIRLYFHPPHTHTDIHDHTGWGVSGTPFGSLSVIRYACEGDIDSGRVRLQRDQQKILQPGEVDLTLAWMEGIHQTGSIDDSINVMISAYGRPGRRLYIHRIDPDSGAAERIYPPRLLRRMLARQALKEISLSM
jgi:predicted metal-dependent enzyme (double-stranded beta helix superfamily)